MKLLKNYRNTQLMGWVDCDRLEGMHWDILDTPRKKILPLLGFARSYDFYLAGGTALALQLGHRHSIDFDFYTKRAFDDMGFERDVVANLNGFIVTQRSFGTLVGQVGVIDISFFYYPYPLIESVVKTEHIDISSTPDIAAMKLIAVSQRGIRRDFLDLYILAQNYGLAQIFEWGKKKYSQFDVHVCLKALTYFNDAEADESGRGMELLFEEQAVQLAKKWL